MKTTRTFWSILTILIVASLLMVACAQEQTAEPTTAAPATEEPMTEEPMTEEPAMTETGEPEMTATAGVPVSGEIDCAGAQQGDEVSLLYQWSGVEEEALNQVLQPVVDACGIVLRPESTRDQALLDTRVQAGTPPDIAFWNVSQLVQYQDQLIAMDELGADPANYADFFITPGTINDRWLGLPVKADVKTLIWYSPENFDALGYTVPTTWDELNALVEQMAADGQVPWSMGFESGDATGWTGTDFIQDILLVQQGPDYVNGIIDGSVPYDDPGVQQAYETYGAWATDPQYTVGGAQGTVSTPFLEAIYMPFQDPPQAMMVKQSGFAGAEIATQFPDLEQGTGYDFFVVPGAQGLQGGADWLMAFNDTPAVRAVVTYLASPQGGANWAQANFGLSPNTGASGNYTAPDLQRLDEALSNTQGFTPDIGDTIPGGFGSAEFNGVTQYVNGGDLNAILSDLAAKQQEALNQ